MEDADQKIIDEAFVGGLLHDIGKLVLASNFPAEYARIVEIGRKGAESLVAAEENTLGANHAEVGGYLLGLWGLPVPVVEAIALHHNPSQGPSLAFGPLTAVHAANGLLNLERGTLMDEELDLKYFAALGLEARLDVWRSALNSGVQA